MNCQPKCQKWNNLTKNYQNLIIGFQVTVKNVGDVFETQCSSVIVPTNVVISLRWRTLFGSQYTCEKRLITEK